MAGSTALSRVWISTLRPPILPLRRACSTSAAAADKSLASNVAATPFSEWASRLASSTRPCLSLPTDRRPHSRYWSWKPCIILRSNIDLPLVRARAAWIRRRELIGNLVCCSYRFHRVNAGSRGSTGLAAIHRESIAARVSGLIGLVRWSFIPASRLRSRSPVMA